MKQRAVKTRTGFDPDLRVSPKWVLAALALLGFALAYASEAVRLSPVRLPLQVLANVGYGLALGLWLLGERRPRIARWSTMVALIALVFLAGGLLERPGILGLLGIPTALIAAVISIQAAAGAAAGVTALLLLLTRTGVISVDPISSAVALLATWGGVAVMVGAYQPVFQLRDWLDEYFEQAQSWLREAREHRAELEQALGDLAHANRQLSLASERMVMLRSVAEEAEQTKAAFVAKVSHEFRTPLNMIIGLVGLMVETPEIYPVRLPPDMERDLEVVHRNCRHLSSMIDDVLDLTRIETGRVTLRREQVDLADIVEEATLAVRPLIEKKGIALSVDVPRDLPLVYCDRTRIRQVVVNLVSNAARFTEEGSITVSVAQRDSTVRVSVTDTGPGVSFEDAERIFEPFCQGRDSAWRDKGGSGLGLSVSRQFVTLHQGRMWLESELGVGSSFIFELPLTPSVERMVVPSRWIRDDWVWREEAFRTESAGLSDQWSRPRMVVCDGTGGIAAELARYADEVEFVEADDLAQAVELVRECPAAAVLFNDDCIAGLSDGFHEAARSMGHTPVIGCAVPQSDRRAVNAGAAAHLIKPIMRTDLEGAIRDLGRPVRRVLLVDDDPDVLHLFTRMLLIYDGRLDIVTASSGEDALEKLRKTDFDLVLLDLVMPEVDGWQVLERMGDDPRIGQVPVFLVSARDPADSPPGTPELLVSIDPEMSINKLLRCSLAISSLLLQPEGKPDPGQQRNAVDGQV